MINRKRPISKLVESRRKKVNSLGNLKAVWIILAFIVGVFLLCTVFTSIFKVRVVDVVFDGYSCGNEDEVRNGLGLYNQTIFWVNNTALSTKVKNTFPCVKEIKISKYLPDKLAVLIEGRVPIALIVKGQGLNGMINLAQVEATAASSAATVDFSIPTSVSSKFFMDHDGVLFYNTDGDVNIPLVYTTRDLAIKDSLGIEMGMGLEKTLEILKKIELSPKLVKIDDANNLIIVGNQNTKIILSLKNGLLKQLASLQLIWQKNKIDSKRIDSIDLRFAKPVVVYSK